MPCFPYHFSHNKFTKRGFVLLSNASLEWYKAGLIDPSNHGFGIWKDPREINFQEALLVSLTDLILLKYGHVHISFFAPVCERGKVCNEVSKNESKLKNMVLISHLFSK
jgi:hypothetical protein